MHLLCGESNQSAVELHELQIQEKHYPGLFSFHKEALGSNVMNSRASLTFSI